MVNTGLRNIWEKLTGDRVSYSMENRAFNYVGLLSFIVIVYFLLFNLTIGQFVMSAVMVVLFMIQSVLYYYSLVKRQYKKSILIYAACSYAALVANYYCNDGIHGPTLYAFFLTFQLLVAVSPLKYSRAWIVLHVVIALFLLFSEYFNPDTVPDTYPSRLSRFLDIGVTYAISILFVFLITNYLKRYYKHEKNLAGERLLAITAKNEEILKQNRDLERLNDEKNKMFSIISHDLRSPIDSIRGYLEVLSQVILDPAEKKGIENELLGQVKYTSDLLQNLLYWSKTQMKGVSVKLVPIRLIDMVDDARNFKLAGAARKEIKMTYAINKDIEVIADKDMLKIVLRNLVVNAIKFTPEGGEISIKLIKKDATALISIQDNGIGIPLEKRKEIFTLKSGSTFGTNDEKGIGLGLVLCKEFIEYQGGEIWFDSEVGKGSTFYISLPLSKM